MSGYQTFEVKSTQKIEFIDITPQVREFVRAAKCREGMLLIFSPHTTAGVTINENADPDVPRDIGEFFKHLLPGQDYFRHAEGNSPAHILSSLVGASETLIVHNDEPLLGSWQGIFFCEFDGPRQRRVFLKVIPG
ncbi:MAG: secondary thiamine-phosphate synthase enzyme YjbQ [Candidatus Aminicenantes bacterium]|jgi:secondary thiamine-phosphate synthase enzyme|nr:secondary thiamine-phosphate synthase enzyme YjbQ [Candidatus Aminicenantes bacterium]